MQTIEEIRRDWLLELIRQYKTIANLNIALGRTRTDATLSQLKNKAADSKSGRPRGMGSPLAREIEEKLGLEHGSLDHPFKNDVHTDNNDWLAYKMADSATKAVVDALLTKGTMPDWVTPMIALALEGARQAAAIWLDSKNEQTKSKETGT
ncbi:hypothetical protein KQ096_002510 [Salmonella enterica]|uniref:Uncharacterized protein n=1 Tax=Salmonella enterica TaxID=28901 RepID=A0A749L512_SALER|nr:hypothetical protein [Salmonella enterica]EJP3909184.1 hypothetical protein [Salmonella enterica]HAF5757873.1 hypothetical protein [Salmonella enterica]